MKRWSTSVHLVSRRPLWQSCSNQILPKKWLDNAHTKLINQTNKPPWNNIYPQNNKFTNQNKPPILQSSFVSYSSPVTSCVNLPPPDFGSSNVTVGLPSSNSWRRADTVFLSVVLFFPLPLDLGAAFFFVATFFFCLGASSSKSLSSPLLAGSSPSDSSSWYETACILFTYKNKCC